MLLPWLFVLGGVVLLFGGAEALVRGSVALAVRFGLTPLVIGLTVVAFGTSMPEMVVSVGAALDGRAAVAAGNVIGSNIGNIALILGLSAIIRPVAARAQIVRIDIPILVVVTSVLILFLLDDAVGRPEGGVLLAGLVVYIVMSLRIARRDVATANAPDLSGAAPGRRLWQDGLLVLGGLALLAVGAPLMVNGAVEIAEAAGVSETVIGLTVVAIGTSLPELAASLVAAARKEGDIAIGNIVGSNLFNILGILGTTSLVRPLRGTGISTLDMTVMIVLTVVLLPFALTARRISRLEGGLLLGSYLGYLALLLA